MGQFLIQNVVKEIDFTPVKYGSNFGLRLVIYIYNTNFDFKRHFHGFVNL